MSEEFPVKGKDIKSEDINVNGLGIEPLNHTNTIMRGDKHIVWVSEGTPQDKLNSELSYMSYQIKQLNKKMYELQNLVKNNKVYMIELLKHIVVKQQTFNNKKGVTEHPKLRF